VAHAIREHYLPRFAGDKLPTSDAARVVGIADRLDSLAGLFAAGMAPTAAKDPFALRRAALGLVQLLIGWQRDFDLEPALDMAIKELPIPMKAEDRAVCLEFIRGRLQSYLLEQGNKFDVVMSVLAAQSRNPYGTTLAVQELTAWTAKAEWKTILPAYARCVRITRDQQQAFKLDAALLKEPAEKDLFKAVEKVEAQTREAGSVDDLLKSFVPLIPSINAFFEKVLVMDKDLALQHNRLGLLQRISKLADGVADLSLLEGF
jgi:glycyl-tRNA synthetase